MVSVRIPYEQLYKQAFYALSSQEVRYNAFLHNDKLLQQKYIILVDQVSWYTFVLEEVFLMTDAITSYVR